MKNLKAVIVFAAVLLVVFVWAFAQPPQKEPPQEVKPTAFQTRCSICHSLSEVRTGMEKIMKEMHHKAGVDISDSSLKEIEATFTLLPMEDPHKGLFQEKCGKCHSLDKVVKAHQTKNDVEMQKIVERMAAKEKSGISKDEIDKINQSMLMLNEIYEPDVELKKEEKK
jgi:nitrate/TMAO reductase-like tetraheme cytochrome c subunit